MTDSTDADLPPDDEPLDLGFSVSQGLPPDDEPLDLGYSELRELPADEFDLGYGQPSEAPDYTHLAIAELPSYEREDEFPAGVSRFLRDFPELRYCFLPAAGVGLQKIGVMAVLLATSIAIMIAVIFAGEIDDYVAIFALVLLTVLYAQSAFSLSRSDDLTYRPTPRKLGLLWLTLLVPYPILLVFVFWLVDGGVWMPLEAHVVLVAVCKTGAVLLCAMVYIEFSLMLSRAWARRRMRKRLEARLPDDGGLLITWRDGLERFALLSRHRPVLARRQPDPLFTHVMMLILVVPFAVIPVNSLDHAGEAFIAFAIIAAFCVMFCSWVDYTLPTRRGLSWILGLGAGIGFCCWIAFLYFEGFSPDDVDELLATLVIQMIAVGLPVAMLLYGGIRIVVLVIHYVRYLKLCGDAVEA